MLLELLPVHLAAVPFRVSPLVLSNGMLSRVPCCCRDRQRRSPDGHAARNRPAPAPLPEKPELYGVYRGRVSNVLEFGCFVEMQGFRKKAEGLVHTNNISKQRRVAWLRAVSQCMHSANHPSANAQQHSSGLPCRVSALGLCEGVA